MSDQDFIIEEPETLEIEPKEEVLTIEPKEEVLDIPGSNLTQHNNDSVIPVNDIPTYNIVSPQEADAKLKQDSAQTQSMDIDKNVEKVEMLTPTIEPISNPQPVIEQAVIQEVATATPNKINDDLLKVEDTLLSNNLKEDIKQEIKNKDEEKQNKKAKAFIITIFLLLGLTILLLPVLTNIFS